MKYSIHRNGTSTMFLCECQSEIEAKNEEMSLYNKGVFTHPEWLSEKAFVFTCPPEKLRKGFIAQALLQMAQSFGELDMSCRGLAREAAQAKMAQMEPKKLRFETSLPAEWLSMGEVSAESGTGNFDDDCLAQQVASQPVGD